MLINPKEKKKTRIKISDINDFRSTLINEGYIINKYNDNDLYTMVGVVFNLDICDIEELKKSIDDKETIYVCKNIDGFIDYIKKNNEIKDCNIKLYNEISHIKELKIHREEYDREPRYQENVDDILKIVDEISLKISERISLKVLEELEYIEEQISSDYLFAKDIELLKKIIISKNKPTEEQYNDEKQIKTILIEVPNTLDLEYIKVKKGSLEYYEHIKNSIPRMNRLIKNIHKYIKCDNFDSDVYNIDHSSAVQDSINIAVATFDNKKFKAISGKTNIEGYCVAPKEEDAEFEASKVNKLGRLGIGYKRVNDSEKKIFEQINNEIQHKKLKDYGELILYSKWEPCPSCYYVISQFCNKYPNIEVKVKYNKKYGEV